MTEQQTGAIDLFWAVNEAIQLLTHEPNIEEAIPDSFQILAEQIAFQSLLYIPIKHDEHAKEMVQFFPALELRDGEIKHLEWPDVSSPNKYQNDQILEAIQYLCTVPDSIFKTHHNNSLSSGDADVLFVSGSHEAIYDIVTNSPLQSFFRGQEIDFEHYLLFPLIVQKKCWGLVALTSAEINSPWKLEQLLTIGTYCTTLANLLVRQETERQLREQRDYLRRTIDLNPNMIFVKKSDHYIAVANKAHADFYGMTVEEMQGSRQTEVVKNEQELNRLVGRDKELWNGEKPFKTLIEKVKDYENKTRWLQTTLTPSVNQQTGKIDELVGVSVDITARKEAELALHESEMKLSSIIEDTKVGIWEWNVQEDKLLLNQNCLDMAGFSEPPSIRSIDLFRSLVNDEDLEEMNKAFAYHTNNNTKFYQTDIRLRHSSGNIRWLQLHGRVLAKNKNGGTLKVSGSVIDIHDRKEADLLLQANEKLLKSTLNTLPDIKVHINQKGEIMSVYAPDHDNTMLRYPPREMVGKNLRECFPFSVVQGVFHNAKLARETRQVQRLEFAESPIDDTSFYEARISAINEEETIIVLRNMSPLKKAEKKLKEKVRELDIKNRQLQTYIESNLQLENFAYIASHDLREPVRTMRSFAQILDRHIGESLDEDGRMYLNYIINGANQMNHLIQDLLTYSRVNSDPLEREKIDLKELINDIKESLSSSITKADAQITTYNLPDHIYGSATRVRQLFQNLIVNAIKFRKAEVSPIVHIECLDDETHWEFCISDNGIGIRKDFHEQIFKLFKKLHSRADFEGTGIGLALCKKIIEQHKGEIWLESKEGVGSAFYFTLIK